MARRMVDFAGQDMAMCDDVRAMLRDGHKEKQVLDTVAVKYGLSSFLVGQIVRRLFPAMLSEPKKAAA